MGESREKTVEKSANIVEDGLNEQHTIGDINLKPIIFCLGLAGCYSFQQKRNVFMEILMFVYKIIVVVGVLVWCIRPFFMTESFQPVLTYVVLTLIGLQGVCNWILSWKSFSKTFGNYQAFVNKMNALITALYNENIIVSTNYIARRQNMYVIFAAFFCLSDIIIQIVIFVVLIPSPETLELLSVNGTFSLTYPFDDSYFTRAINILPGLLVSFLIVIPPFYLAIINTVSIATFDVLNTKLEGCLTRNGDIFEYVEMFRRFHVKTCGIISRLDKDFRYLYGSIVFWTLCQAVFVLYLLIRSDRSLMEVITLLYMMGLSVAVLIVMSVSAALVHEAAHAPLETLYNINIETISLEKATQLNLFLSKLTGTQVGFTTFGLLTITKEFILTIVGVFITYFAVLYTTL